MKRIALSAGALLAMVVLAASGLTQAQGDRMQAAWDTLQADEAAWSSAGRHERVQNASHYIQSRNNPRQLYQKVDRVL